MAVLFRQMPRGHHHHQSREDGGIEGQGAELRVGPGGLREQQHPARQITGVALELQQIAVTRECPPARVILRAVQALKP